MKEIFICQNCPNTYVRNDKFEIHSKICKNAPSSSKSANLVTMVDLSKHNYVGTPDETIIGVSTSVEAGNSSEVLYASNSSMVDLSQSNYSIVEAGNISEVLYAESLISNEHRVDDTNHNLCVSGY